MKLSSGDKNPIFFKTLVDTIPNPIFYKDLDRRFTGCNTAFENFFGTTEKKLIGKTVYDIAPKELANIYNKHDDLLLNNPGKDTYESLLLDSQGVTHNVVFNKATFTNEKGQVDGIVGIILDITDIKNIEQLTKEKAENLERINKLMIDRELKMIELKKRIEELEQEKNQRCKNEAE